MAKKEEIYPEGYPRQTENFSDEQKFKFDVFEAIREIALDTTEKAFEEKGYKKQDGRAGEYGTGASYGAGTSSSHFNVRLSSRASTNTYFEKIIYFGGKKAISDVTIGWDAKNKKIELAYKTSEFGAFRGYHEKNSYNGAMLINDRSNFVIDSIQTFKKELKDLFKKFADKEVAYITSTKIGIEDKTNKSINSMVENSMKKYNLKDLMTSSDEELSNTVDNYIQEGKEDKDNNVRMNNPEIIAANSSDKLLFDDIEDIKDDGIKTAAKNKLKKFGVVAINELKPSEKKTYFEELEKELEIKEITAGGGSAAGAAYNTPFAFKKGGDLNLKEENEKFENTPYAKAQKPKMSVKKTMKEGDSFWTNVELNPGSGYVPKGMEHNFEIGNHSKNTDSNYPGKIKESEEKNNPSLIKESLIKRKFATLNENKEKGINKKYIVTEQRSESEQNERWSRLALFESKETIKHAENIIEECGCENVETPSNNISMEQGQKANEKEFMQRNSDAEAGESLNGRNVVVVAKPGSLSNAKFKVFEDEYLNENMTYIKDLNSGNLVLNPNYKSK